MPGAMKGKGECKGYPSTNKRAEKW
ncbi:hypothetical protein I310_00002 [Cryptococcus deuterogattii CA1014]|nr:hypothetical protein I310_00002 [Cryptococcus deuterogattii CA1014]